MVEHVEVVVKQVGEARSPKSSRGADKGRGGPMLGPCSHAGSVFRMGKERRKYQ